MIASIPTSNFKNQLSAAMTQEVQTFLASGGLVVEIPFGVGQDSNLETFRSMQAKIALMNRASK